MCHYHSVVVTRKGQIIHQPHNSHSRMASEAGLLNNDTRTYFWEGECDFSVANTVEVFMRATFEVRLRMVHQHRVTRLLDKIPARAAVALVEHYHQLAKVHQSGVLPKSGVFATPEYLDVQAKIKGEDIRRVLHDRTISQMGTCKTFKEWASLFDRLDNGYPDASADFSAKSERAAHRNGIRLDAVGYLRAAVDTFDSEDLGDGLLDFLVKSVIRKFRKAPNRWSREIDWDSALSWLNVSVDHPLSLAVLDNDPDAFQDFAWNNNLLDRLTPELVVRLVGACRRHGEPLRSRVQENIGEMVSDGSLVIQATGRKRRKAKR